MSKLTGEKAIKYFLSHSQHEYERRFIGFYGGEPLLAFDLVKELCFL
jgi:sulfatase maturation enzyme AslB (radical SAM superfamily)